MEIRRLGPGDEADAIAAIHVLKPASERDGLDATGEHMRRLLGRDENYLYLAKVEGRPVGFLIAHRFPRVDRDRDMVYLYEIDVATEHRRRGIGTRMIELLKEDCRGDGVLKIWVGAESDNVAARELYEKTGARLEGQTYAEYTYFDL